MFHAFSHSLSRPTFKIDQHKSGVSCSAFFNNLTPEIKSLRATLPDEIVFYLGFCIFKGLTARRLYMSFGVNGLNPQGDQVRGEMLIFLRWSCPQPGVIRYIGIRFL
jgi:hypothetical protein